MRRRSSIVMTSLLLGMLLAPVAEAQDLAAAEALFNKGLAEMEAGQFATACPALAESYRLDPRPGTLFTVAECEAKAGRVATAVARYEDYLSLFNRLTPDQQAKQKGREKTSAEQKAALMPQVPKLTLVLPPNAPRETAVKRNDIAMGSPAMGVPLPVDPGEHVITTQVPGGPVHEQRITIAKGENKRIELEIRMPEAAPAAAAQTGPPSATEDPAFNADASKSGNSQRTWAFVAGGVGAAGIVVGSIFGGLTMGKKGTIEDNCDGPKCNAEGKDAADSAQTLGLVSTIGFGVGVAGLATGAVLFFTAPKPKKETARNTAWMMDVSPNGARVGMRGAW